MFRTRHQPAAMRSSNNATPASHVDTIHGSMISMRGTLALGALAALSVISIGSITSVVPSDAARTDVRPVRTSGTGGSMRAVVTITAANIAANAPHAMPYRTDAD